MEARKAERFTGDSSRSFVLGPLAELGNSPDITRSSSDLSGRRQSRRCGSSGDACHCRSGPGDVTTPARPSTLESNRLRSQCGLKLSLGARAHVLPCIRLELCIAANKMRDNGPSAPLWVCMQPVRTKRKGSALENKGLQARCALWNWVIRAQ